MSGEERKSKHGSAEEKVRFENVLQRCGGVRLFPDAMSNPRSPVGPKESSGVLRVDCKRQKVAFDLDFASSLDTPADITTNLTYHGTDEQYQYLSESNYHHQSPQCLKEETPVSQRVCFLFRKRIIDLDCTEAARSNLLSSPATPRAARKGRGAGGHTGSFQRH